jgi:uncharacterized protein
LALTCPDRQLEQRLVALARATPWFMQALAAARSLGLASWCIGAGAVRSMVWDSLHGKDVPSALPDVDVAYFDAGDLAGARDCALQARLAALAPGLPWEVTNQAGVHLWFEHYFGKAVEPLASLQDGVASWPEFATAVGLWLDPQDGIGVIAPHGLDDLFDCVVRHNPARASVANFRQRVEQKRYQDRWPQVRIIHP